MRGVQIDSHQYAPAGGERKTVQTHARTAMGWTASDAQRSPWLGRALRRAGVCPSIDFRDSAAGGRPASKEVRWPCGRLFSCFAVTNRMPPPWPAIYDGRKPKSPGC